jgi:hypothetical protein
MRSYGVGYDTGIVLADRTTRTAFDENVVRRELEIIRTDLHASAVRVYGNHRDRLATAGRLALDAGLDLWLAPFPVDVDAGDLPAYLATYAADADALRSRRSAGDGPEVVLVLGCELSLSARGFVPGDTWDQRAAALTDPASFADPARLAELQLGLERWRQTQQAIAGAARGVFGGRITYAAGMWEEVDWSLFDVVSVDAYRDAANAATFGDTVRGWRSHGKPVAVTEFGCATYRGAAARGGTGWAVVDRGVDPPRLDGDYLRDEQEQVRYLREVLPVLEAGDVDTAFWFSFAGFELPHRPQEPDRDLDVSSYGLVAVLDEGNGARYPETGWEPKAAFDALAQLYGRRAASGAQRR